MKHAAVLLGLGLALLFTSCATTGVVTVPRIPEWRTPTDTRTFTNAALRTELHRLAPGAHISLTDATFTPLSHEWLEATIPWSWHFAKAIGFTYTPESGDCDKFALIVAGAANVAASRAGVKAQPLAARFDTHQLQPFGGVPAGGSHALNAFLTDRGIYVLEPQSRVLVPLSQYPNRKLVFNIRIGG